MGRFAFNPFKKNRYFYGKRLDVADFKTEQSYMDAKRYMLNRNVVGAGIVYGLNVRLEAGSQTLRLEPGLALDGRGREIVVPAVVEVKFADIPGVHRGRSGGERNYLLCARYDELPGEPSGLPRSGEVGLREYDYGRILEGYALEVKRAEDVKAASIPNLFYSPAVVFKNKRVTLTRLAPAWVNPNEVFRVMFIAERIDGKAGEDVTFEMTEAFVNPPDFQPDVKLMDFYKTPGASPNLSLTLKAGQKRAYCGYFARSLYDPYPGGEEAVCEIRLGSFLYKSGGAAGIAERDDKPSAVRTVATPISEKFLEAYFKNNYMDLFPMVDDDFVYLAEVIVKTPEDPAAPPVAVLAERGVWPDRNRGHVYNNTLLYQLIRNIEARMAYQKMPPVITAAEAGIAYASSAEKPKVLSDFNKSSGKLSFDFRFPTPVVSGVVVFDVYAERLEKGDYDISESIRPGAALNVESVQAVWDRSRFSDNYVSGEKLMYGVEPDKNSGSFRIWYRTAEDFELNAVALGAGGETARKRINQLHFRWWAYSGMEAIPKETRAKTLTLLPRRLSLTGNAETADFRVSYGGGPLDITARNLSWKIFDKNHRLLRAVSGADIAVTRHAEGGAAFKLNAARNFDLGVSEYIVECGYNGAVAIAYVGADRKEASHDIRLLAPAPNANDACSINLREQDPYLIKWAYTPGIQSYKINIRREDTSAIVFSETLPGDSASLLIRKRFFSFGGSGGGAQCRLDIFAYYSAVQRQHKDYRVWIEA